MSDAKRADGPRTLVEEGTALKGSLTSSCPIDVKGRVDGELTAPSLTVSATGAVHGKVKVEDLVSEGEISGEVEADVVRLSGVVKDNTVLRAKSLEVKLVAASGNKVQVTFGDCVLEIGDAPTREAEASPKKDEPAKGTKAETKSETKSETPKPDEAKATPAEGGAPRSIPPPKGTPSVPPPHLS